MWFACVPLESVSPLTVGKYASITWGLSSCRAMTGWGGLLQIRHHLLAGTQKEHWPPACTQTHLWC